MDRELSLGVERRIRLGKERIEKRKGSEGRTIISGRGNQKSFISSTLISTKVIPLVPCLRKFHVNPRPRSKPSLIFLPFFAFKLEECSRVKLFTLGNGPNFFFFSYRPIGEEKFERG